MRLTAHEIAAIKAAAAQAFGPDAVVRLFGSRVDDARRGGDIDLLIEARPADEWRARSEFEDRLFELIEPQRVDVVLTPPDGPREPFVALISRQTVTL